MNLLLTNYHFDELLHETSHAIVYKASSLSNNQKVILKISKEQYISGYTRQRYQQEYDILEQLQSSHIIKAFQLIDTQEKLALVLEDFEGDALRQLYSKTKFSLHEKLQIAIKITEAIDFIHNSNIIHKDVNPSNIVYNLHAKQLKFIDFGLATALPREITTLKNPEKLEGTLPYISPEQTGRMNRAVDYRSDFYSLGITLYELFAEQLPFYSQDAMELVHCHLAIQAKPPHEINQQIPLILSQIIMKLIEKNAEERYQSALGIKADLLRCISCFEQQNWVSFPLATQDVISRLQLPQKLYGRDHEIQTLLKSFDYISQGNSSLLLVSGYSGLGKSSLVQEIYRPITEKHGYFINGKFDQLQRNIPYFAILQAMRSFMLHLLGESDVHLEIWKTKLLSALGNQGQVIIDVIPEVEWIIGKQPEVSFLPPIEAQNRFNLVFQKFLKVFCKQEHPLVIFLDDLQWSDLASLKLISLSIDTPYLLIIGAYRDNEVSPSHPLMEILETIEKAISIQHIHLNPLNETDINQYLIDTFHCAVDKLKDFTKLLLQKTAGNPFFMSEFLKTLYRENLLFFNTQQQGWDWNLLTIEQQNITDNVVELMAAKINKLPNNTQILLKSLSCIGNQSTIENFYSIVHAKNIEEILQPALLEGLILKLDNLYKFSHDRIQQAAYSLLTAQEKVDQHWAIGQQWLKEKTKDIFSIVDQLNAGFQTQYIEEQRIQLIELNRQATHKAKESAAFEAAWNYIKYAIDLTEENFWGNRYDLMLNLYTDAAEVALLTAQFETLEQLASIVLEKGLNLLDKITIYDLKVQAYTLQHQPTKSIKVALEILELLGEKIPATPSQLHIITGLIKLQFIAGKNAQKFESLPKMTNPTKLAAIRICARVMPAAFFASPTLFPLLAFKLVTLSIKNGIAEPSAYAFCVYGLILCGVLENIEIGYQFGKLGINLLARNTQIHSKATILQTFANHIQHWKEPLQNTINTLQIGYYEGLDEGNFEFGGYSSVNFIGYSFLAGNINLQELQIKIQAHREMLQKIGQKIASNYLNIYYQTLTNLIEETNQPSLLEGQFYSETQMIPVHVETQDKTGLFLVYYTKLMLAYLNLEYKKADEYARHAEKNLDGVVGMYVVVIFHFYDALTQLALYKQADKTKQSVFLKKIKHHHKKLKKWAKYSPANHLHKSYLIEAELLRIDNKLEKSKYYYEEAARLARDNGFLNEYALILETAGVIYIEENNLRLAKSYLQEAYQTYQHWGAKLKVKQLANKYNQLIYHASFSSSIFESTATSSQTGSVSKLSNLDLLTVIKASQTLAGEIILTRLLEKMMNLVIENMGAENGYLLLQKQQQWVSEAEIKSGRVITSKSRQLTKEDIPLNIISYVLRTQQHVMLENANNSNFSTDDYIKIKQPKSILCFPLILQKKLSGILYMENNLVSGVFNHERLEVIKLLSTQIAISLENAKLYTEVQANEQQLQQFLEAVPLGIGIIDKQGRPYYLNQHGVQLLGKGVQNDAVKDQIIQEYQLFIQNTDNEYPSDKLPVIKALQGEYAHVDDLEVHQPNKIVPLEAWGTPIFDSTKEIIYAMTVFHDISDRKQAEATRIRFIQEQEEKNAALRYSEEIQQKNTQLIQLNQEKNEFLGIAAHDLKNPLSGIHGLAEIMRDSADILSSEDIRQYSQMIYNESERMFQLITNLLDVNAIESGKINCKLEAVDIFAILQKLLKIYSERAKTKEITLHFSSFGEKFIAFSDQNISEQILDNLISNAIKYSPQQKNVYLKLYLQEDKIRCEIKDEGPGLSEEDQKKLFGKFTRLTARPTSGEHSTGLGLFIVKKLVTAIQGDVWCESVLSQGATFIVTFPKKQ